MRHRNQNNDCTTHDVHASEIGGGPNEGPYLTQRSTEKSLQDKNARSPVAQDDDKFVSSPRNSVYAYFEAVSSRTQVCTSGNESMSANPAQGRGQRPTGQPPGGDCKFASVACNKLCLTKACTMGVAPGGAARSREMHAICWRERAPRAPARAIRPLASRARIFCSADRKRAAPRRTLRKKRLPKHEGATRLTPARENKNRHRSKGRKQNSTP